MSFVQAGLFGAVVGAAVGYKQIWILVSARVPNTVLTSVAFSLCAMFGVWYYNHSLI